MIGLSYVSALLRIFGFIAFGAFMGNTL